MLSTKKNIRRKIKSHINSRILNWRLLDWRWSKRSGLSQATLFAYVDDGRRMFSNNVGLTRKCSIFFLKKHKNFIILNNYWLFKSLFLALMLIFLFCVKVGYDSFILCMSGIAFFRKVKAYGGLRNSKRALKTHPNAKISSKLYRPTNNPNTRHRNALLDRGCP